MAGSAAASTEPAPPPIDNLVGARWMIASSVCFALVAVFIKRLGGSFPPAEIVFFRCFFGLSIVVPFVARRGWRVYRTQSPGLHAIRVLCAFAAMQLTFYGLTHLPLATATALSFTRPLFMILLGVLLLGEVVRWRRGLATALGFAGVMIVLGPISIGSVPAALAALGGAAMTAGAMAVVRRQAATDGPATIMAWFTTGTAGLTAFPAMFVWRTPDHAWEWAMLAGCGLVASLGQYFMIRAFIHGEATVMNPIDYSQILMTAAFGYAVFGEVPHATLWLGATVIGGSTLYILFREAKLKRAAVTQPPAP